MCTTIINYDATQFSLSAGNSYAVEVVVPKKAKEMWNGKPISTDPNSSIKDRDFVIKWFCIVNAAGQTCNDLVSQVADGQMGEEDVLAYCVAFLTAGVSQGNGFVCFC